MDLRKDMEVMMARTKAFHDSNAGGALIQIHSVGDYETPEKTDLRKWCFPGELEAYLDHKVRNFVHYWQFREELEDDMIPAVYPWFGIAEHSAFIGGEVDFSEHTSWHHQLIQSWADMERLELKEDNTWLRMVIDGMAYLKEVADGRFAVSLRGAEGPMDIANALRGNDFFTDFYLYPEETKKLMAFCKEAAAWTLKHQKAAVGDFYGGTLTGYDVWIPGNSIGHLSEDASVMCSEDTYREFGLPYTAQLTEQYDYAFMHTHAAGAHNMQPIAELPGMRYIQISNDPNAPRAIETYKERFTDMTDKVITLKMKKQEILDNLEFLKERKTIIKYEAADLADAREVIELVRQELSVNITAASN